MSKADEMFEELGYKQNNIKSTDGDIILTVYEKEQQLGKKHFNKTINFNIIDGYLSFKNLLILDKKELQAINEKVKELGWLDVK